MKEIYRREYMDKLRIQFEGIRIINISDWLMGDVY